MNNNDMNFFQSTRYVNKTNRKKTLILDIEDSSEDKSLGSGTQFNINLFEPLIIDKQSELYLDNFITLNAMMADVRERLSFSLKINEFNVDTNSASNGSNQNIKSSIIIPNENRHVDNFFQSVSHKAKKYNYICDINPMTISKISGKISDLYGHPIFHGNTNNGSYNTYMLVGVAGAPNSKWAKVPTSPGLTTLSEMSAADKSLVPVGTTFELSGTEGENDFVTCKTVSTFEKDSNDLYFVFDNDQDDVTGYNNKPNVRIKFTGDNLDSAKPDAKNASGNDMVIFTKYPSLFKMGGRMIAEFSIISRD